MNGADWFLLTLLGVAIAAAIRAIHRRGGCRGSCAGCMHQGSCSSNCSRSKTSR